MIFDNITHIDKIKIYLQTKEGLYKLISCNDVVRRRHDWVMMYYYLDKSVKNILINDSCNIIGLNITISKDRLDIDNNCGEI